MDRPVHALPAGGAAGSTLYLNRRVRRDFAGDSDYLRSPEARRDVGRYLSDLLRPYQLPLDEARLIGGAGHSYGEMAAALVREAVEEPVDLLVLAFAIPDVWPGRATATYLSELCPGNPLSFAVCDQGVAAGFTALRVVREYLPVCPRALVLIVEQPVLHYPPAGPAAIPAGAAGVALACSARPGAGALRVDSIEVRPAVPLEQAAAVLDPAGASVSAGPVVVGNGLAGLAGLALPGPVRGVPPGRPYTGVWWELAGSSQDLMLADYDPALRYLCTATMSAVTAVSSA